jgi:hypothetical protein
MSVTSRCRQHFDHVSVYEHEPTPVRWARLEDMLLAFMLPKARELLAKQRVERDAERGIPEYIEEGL